MKKLFLLAGMALLSTATFAQTELGRSLWTGSASASFISPNRYLSVGDNPASPTISINFSRGAFIRDNWLIGGGIDGSFRQIKGIYSNGATTYARRNSETTTGVNGFVRRYWGREKWRVFVGGGLSVGMSVESSKASDIYPSNSYRTTNFFFRPFTQAGANYFLNDRIGLEVAATSNTFPFAVNTLNVGLVLLNGEKRRVNDDIIEAPQTARGRWILSGGFDFNTYKYVQPANSDSKSSSFLLNLSPSIGFFVSKNNLLGVSIPLAYWRSGSDVRSSLLWGINPYFKHYVSDNRLRPFVGGSLMFLQSSNKDHGSSYVASRIFGGNINAGLAYMLGERFIVEAGLGGLSVLRTVSNSLGSNDRNWTVSLSGTLRPGFNLVYVFR